MSESAVRYRENTESGDSVCSPLAITEGLEHQNGEYTGTSTWEISMPNRLSEWAIGIQPMTRKATPSAR
jgi:hypothetical protein